MGGEELLLIKLIVIEYEFKIVLGVETPLLRDLKGRDRERRPIK